MISIRTATEDDAEELLAIYAPYVKQTAITLSMMYHRRKILKAVSVIHWKNILIWWQKRMER